MQVTGDVRGLRVGVVQEGLANCEPDVIEVRERGSHTIDTYSMVIHRYIVVSMPCSSSARSGSQDGNYRHL